MASPAPANVRCWSGEGVMPTCSVQPAGGLGPHTHPFTSVSHPYPCLFWYPEGHSQVQSSRTPSSLCRHVLCIQSILAQLWPCPRKPLSCSACWAALFLGLTLHSYSSSRIPYSLGIAMPQPRSSGQDSRMTPGPGRDGSLTSLHSRVCPTLVHSCPIAMC